MTIRLAAPLQSDSVVDGYGIRTVIWTQGCSHNCPFCQNPQTHDFSGGEVYDIQDVLNEIDELKNQDGITLSGGDPLFQIEPVLEIVKHCKKNSLNVWCYTGFTYERILEMCHTNPMYKEFLENIDVLVDGRFEIAKKNLNILFRGSENQRLIDMPKTLSEGKVVLLEEKSDIISDFKETKEKMYI